MKSINSGVYPTMITPYSDDKTVDYEAVKKLVRWYSEQGCDGVFASCQSSEIWFLPLEDRVKLAKTVREENDRIALEHPERRKMSIVASGHVSESFKKQVEELSLTAETGVDAVVLITNRMDIENTAEDKWISDTKRLIGALDKKITLGLYECPSPYKRLLTPKMLEWVIETGRFAFIKDTCCDPETLESRAKLLQGTSLQSFNANGQTLLLSLRQGGAGYCGIMANMHPRLYAWLCENYEKNPDMAEYLQAVLGMASFAEYGMPYPTIAKYHLNEFEGIKMSLFSRSRERSGLTEYEKECMAQMNRLMRGVETKLN